MPFVKAVTQESSSPYGNIFAGRSSRRPRCWKAEDIRILTSLFAQSWSLQPFWTLWKAHWIQISSDKMFFKTCLEMAKPWVGYPIFKKQTDWIAAQYSDFQFSKTQLRWNPTSWR